MSKPITNRAAAILVLAAIAEGKVLTIKCANGDTVTASEHKVVRWGDSRFALPSGQEIMTWNIGHTVVEQCGRGAAAAAARKALAS